MKGKIESDSFINNEVLLHPDIPLDSPTEAFLKNIPNTYIENISDIMIAYTLPDGRFLLPPKKIFNLLGYAGDDYPKTIWELTKDEDTNIERQLLQELLDGTRTSYSIEKRALGKDAREKWFLKYAFLIRKNDAPIKYILNFLIDITKSKKVEEELRRINYKYKKLLDLLFDIVVIVNNDLITFASDGIKKLGYETDEVVGKNAEFFLVKDDLKPVRSLAKQAKELPDAICGPLEIKLIKKDGQVIDMEFINVGFMDEQGLSLMSVFRDITERKRSKTLESEVLQKQILLNQVKEADNLKNEFIANISHELRSPLNVIMGVLQLMSLAKDKHYGYCDSFDRYIKLIRQNCYRLLRLINNLIDISKMDAGFFRIRLKKCDIVKIVEDITLSVAEYAESKGLSLIFDTDEEEKIIYCDQDQIERIILNLLSNSIKFTVAGGSITINMETTEDNVKIIIKDTGIGIPEDQLSTIFDRFKQAADGYGGSGIGLSLVKSLVEMHGGEITVKSEINHGTEFIVTLHVDSKGTLCEDTTTMKRTKDYDNLKIEFSDIYPSD